jgi:transposase
VSWLEFGFRHGGQLTETKPTKFFHVTLTPVERAELDKMIRTGIAAAAKLAKARVLLLADESDGGPGKSDAQIHDALGVGKSTIFRVRRQFVEEGVEAAIGRKEPDRVYARKLDGRAEAHLVTLACSKPPEGRSKWTLRLLADQMVVMGHVDTVSYETVRETLKKTRSNPG